MIELGHSIQYLTIIGTLFFIWRELSRIRKGIDHINREDIVKESIRKYLGNSKTTKL